MTREDPELGTERYCRGCDDWWPQDGEFFYIELRGARVVWHCRACRDERSRTYRERLRPKVVLGPVRCQGCRRLVSWCGWEWRDGKGSHTCPSNARSTILPSDGSSVEPNTIQRDTRPSATTRSAGVMASIGVVDR